MGSAIIVRPLRHDEDRIYLEIVNRAIRGLAAGHYPPAIIDAWAVAITDERLNRVTANADREIRIIGELNGVPAAIGALVVESSELRACYVVPEAARHGCGSAIVREIEWLAREHRLTRLELVASVNAEPFYASQGYEALEHTEYVIRPGHRMAAVRMHKDLAGRGAN